MNRAFRQMEAHITISSFRFWCAFLPFGVFASLQTLDALAVTCRNGRQMKGRVRGMFLCRSRKLRCFCSREIPVCIWHPKHGHLIILKPPLKSASLLEWRRVICASFIGESPLVTHTDVYNFRSDPIPLGTSLRNNLLPKHILQTDIEQHQCPSPALPVSGLQVLGMATASHPAPRGAARPSPRKPRVCRTLR